MFGMGTGGTLRPLPPQWVNLFKWGFIPSGVPCQMHYMDVEYDAWLKQIEKRNDAVKAGLSNTYVVDEGLLKKLESLFEVPSEDEIDVYYFNRYGA